LGVPARMLVRRDIVLLPRSKYGLRWPPYDRRVHP